LRRYGIVAVSTEFYIDRFGPFITWREKGGRGENSVYADFLAPAAGHGARARLRRARRPAHWQDGIRVPEIPSRYIRVSRGIF
jgi:hypothetical protein